MTKNDYLKENWEDFLIRVENFLTKYDWETPDEDRIESVASMLAEWDEQFWFLEGYYKVAEDILLNIQKENAKKNK